MKAERAGVGRTNPSIQMIMTIMKPNGEIGVSVLIINATNHNPWHWSRGHWSTNPKREKGSSSSSSSTTSTSRPPQFQFLLLLLLFRLFSVGLSIQKMNQFFCWFVCWFVCLFVCLFVSGAQGIKEGIEPSCGGARCDAVRPGCRFDVDWKRRRRRLHVERRSGAL